MKPFRLTGRPNRTSPEDISIFCPTLAGLSGRQADLAMLMPRIDNNRALFTSEKQELGSYAGVLTCNPFGTSANFLRRLSDHGYSGVANWPSSILFEGQTKQMMKSMPATPELEYAWLAGAQQSQFQTLAFFRSLEQGRMAIKEGLHQLVLHPGLIPQGEDGPSELPIASLRGLIEKLKQDAKDVEILFYEHTALDGKISAEDLGASGWVYYDPVDLTT